MLKRDSLKILATVKNLDVLMDWLDNLISSCGYTGNAKVQLDIAVEEIFVNIAHYAYEYEGAGSAVITVEVDDNPLRVMVRFEDTGREYNPMTKKDPDINLPIKERKIGGLGIFMTKNSMDNMTYEYRDGKNILTIIKKHLG